MTRRLAAAALLLVLLAGGCASSGGGPAETQEKFGVRMAKMNLWREAMFRFRRAVEMTPDDAMAHNNLAVALEANGDFEGAGKSYREAMRLDKSNQFIQKNYSRFVEFTTRDRRRQQRKMPTPSAVTPAEDAPKAEEGERPKPALPVVSDPAQPPTPAEASDPEHGDPAPTSAAPAVTPAPNPAPPPTPPSTDAPPGGAA
jgi:tetratricopeptide (TPR) repeat protein